MCHKFMFVTCLFVWFHFDVASLCHLQLSVSERANNEAIIQSSLIQAGIFVQGRVVAVSDMGENRWSSGCRSVPVSRPEKAYL